MQVSKKLILLILSFVMIWIVACEKETTRIEPNAPNVNPFGDTTTNPNTIQLDSNSFLGIHHFIFSKKCAQPACHDGAFEPDFRTPQSSYSQLVYHNVVKNDANNTFTYRVMPSDTALSWLHERITTDDPILGRMPLYDVLPDEDIQRIENWILNGAPDMFGNQASTPSYQPSVFGVIAYQDSSNTGIRLDNTRANTVSPMIFPQNTDVELWFAIFDRDQNGDIQAPIGLGNNKLKMSLHPYDFSSATELNFTVRNITNPYNGPNPWGTGMIPYYYSIRFSTSMLNAGSTYYLRTYLKDPDFTDITEIPNAGSQNFWLSYFSFTVQ